MLMSRARTGSSSTLDGKLVLVSTLGGPNLTVIDAATRKTVKVVPMGDGAAGILMEPGRSPCLRSLLPETITSP